MFQTTKLAVFLSRGHPGMDPKMLMGPLGGVPGFDPQKKTKVPLIWENPNLNAFRGRFKTCGTSPLTLSAIRNTATI